ncbi:MAG TPA: sensor histidine kinase [Bryobacteraceae bacterium]|jgi:signal transduction histidine kinase|nr:sensor histidine kinase [Bryobacteraceae bacterium]
MTTRTGQPETDLTLSCLVHDLNNVFQTLVEAADLLSDDPRYAAVSAAILRSIERGKSITSSIRSSEETPAAFETILDNAISFVEDSMISGRGPRIRFIREIDPGIELRRTWAWERVLINLFSNAVRAMPQGGVIYIKARRTEREIEIVVRDEGPGIAVEILKDIFKPHVSTHGSGLGLHIVETIVKQDDGEVRAVNRPDGRGAEFTIRVPAIVPGFAVPARA